jgi:ubinuclein
MPKAKKRALSTTSESSEGEGKPNDDPTVSKSKKKKKRVDKKAKSGTSSSDEQGKAAKKAKKDKPEKPKEIPLPPKEPEKKKVVEKETPVDDSKKVIKTTTVKDMLRAKRDNLRKLEQGKSSGGTTTTTDNDEDDGSNSVSSLAVSETSRESHNGELNGKAATTSKELTLPTTFSAELVQLITSLKQHADTTLKNPATFFDNHVKEQLLQIDTVAKTQSQQVRVQVYHQLETFLPCTRKTILTKVNRYRTQQAEGRIKNEIKKLKAIVNDAMPDLVRKFDEEQKRYEVQQVVGGEPLDLKSPRKKYHWNDNSRQILSDTILYINELYRITKVKKETLEEYSTKYLREHLLPLWPESWIKLEDFQKELERKKKKDARSSSQGSQATSPVASSQSSVNGKQSAQLPSSHQQQLQKTDSRHKEMAIIIPAVNGKTPPIQLSPQSSVIKKSSDHSINSIMSTSPSPPIHSSSKSAAANSTPTSSVLTETKTTRIIDLDKLSSPNDLLKTSQKPIPKYSQPAQMSPVEVSPEKVRISDGSDSDCAIIESPGKTTPTLTVKPQQQFSQHLNNNKLNHSPVVPQQGGGGGGEMKKTKKNDSDYSSLIKNIASLTVSMHDCGKCEHHFNMLLYFF